MVKENGQAAKVLRNAHLTHRQGIFNVPCSLLQGGMHGISELRLIPVTAEW